MAEQAVPQPDRDLASIAEARALARRAKQAWLELAEFSQERIDAIVDAIAEAATAHAEGFATLAVEETGFGLVADKIRKNLFCSQKVYQFIRPMKTVGVIRRLEDRKVIEIAEPFGAIRKTLTVVRVELAVGGRVRAPLFFRAGGVRPLHTTDF